MGLSVFLLHVHIRLRPIVKPEHTVIPFTRPYQVHEYFTIAESGNKFGALCHGRHLLADGIIITFSMGADQCRNRARPV